MANTTYEVLEFRAVIKPDWTELYVLCGPPSDGILGVQGWHKKIIPKDVPVMPYLQNALLKQEFLTHWDIGSPN